MAEPLVIRISGNASELQKEFNKIKSQTQALESTLGSVAKNSAIAFAGFTGVIAGSVAAYRGQELAVNKLNQSLINQGIYSEELSNKYQRQASELQKLTLHGDEAVVEAQAQLQAFLGQTEITEDLTKAVADLATAQGIDLVSAASLVGKSIGSSTNALQRNGIEIDTSASKQEKLAQAVAGINRLYGGQAEAAAQGTGAITQFKMAIGDALEPLGKRFAPILESVTKRLTNLVNTLAENKPLIDFIANFVGAGAVLTGIVASLAVAALAFLKIRLAVKLTSLAIKALTASFGGLAAATGIGLVIVALGLLVANWDTAVNYITASFIAFAKNISNLAGGVKDILVGVFTFDKDQIAAGLEAARSAFSEGLTTFNEELAALEEERAAAERSSQEKIEDQLNQHNNRKIASLSAEAQQEIDLLKKLKDERENILKTQITTEEQARLAADNAKLKESVDAHNQFLIEEQRYGTTLAAIQRDLRTREFQKFKTGTSELVALTNSRNQELKTIGKAATITQIGIKTAEAAINVVAGFTNIPIIGPALGFAAAAAIIAYGAEQISSVIAAADGGLITGGIKGKDSVPAMLMPGELVVPQRNFEEVVSATAASRAGQFQNQSVSQAATQTGNISPEATIRLELSEELMNFVETKLVERKSLGISLLPAGF